MLKDSSKMESLSKLFSGPSDILKKWHWLVEATKVGNVGPFLYHFEPEVNKHRIGTGNNAILFLIGKALKCAVKERTLFDKECTNDDTMENVRFAVQFYLDQLRAARKAVDTWTLVGLNFRVVKDIRILIGKMIWEARNDANYTTTREKRGGDA